MPDATPVTTSQGRLQGKVAVVAGATRGAGRGIAVELGAAGATVYCTGRSTRSNPSAMKRPETIEESAELVTAAGGKGIAVQVDHTVPEQVEALFAQVARDHQGRLDILVNDVWGGEKLVEWGKPLWETNLEQGLQLFNQAVLSHVITSRYGVPLMVARGEGLVIEVTDGDSLDYRGNFFYDLVKTTVIRLATNLHEEFRAAGLTRLTAVALTPGFLRSEEMLEHFGVSESNWRDGAKKDPHFIASETPHYIGRAVAALASDPNVSAKSGQALATWTLVPEYGFTDQDGSQPNWGEYFDKNIKQNV